MKQKKATKTEQRTNDINGLDGAGLFLGMWIIMVQAAQHG